MLRRGGQGVNRLVGEWPWAGWVVLQGPPCGFPVGKRAGASGVGGDDVVSFGCGCTAAAAADRVVQVVDPALEPFDGVFVLDAVAPVEHVRYVRLPGRRR